MQKKFNYIDFVLIRNFVSFKFTIGCNSMNRTRILILMDSLKFLTRVANANKIRNLGTKRNLALTINDKGKREI